MNTRHLFLVGHDINKNPRRRGVHRYLQHHALGGQKSFYECWLSLGELSTLLAHDIRDRRRLQKVWRFLRKEGVRLQYSVYLLAGQRQQIEQIIDQLRLIIDEREDDVRIYPLTDSTRIWCLGRQFNDDGSVLCDAFMDKLKQADAEQRDGDLIAMPELGF